MKSNESLYFSNDNNNEQIEEKKRQHPSKTLLNVPEEDSLNQLTLKMVFVGDISIRAKTTLIARLIYGTFDERFNSSMNSFSYEKRINVGGEQYKLVMFGLPHSFLLPNVSGTITCSV